LEESLKTLAPAKGEDETEVSSPEDENIKKS